MTLPSKVSREKTKSKVSREKPKSKYPTYTEYIIEGLKAMGCTEVHPNLAWAEFQGLRYRGMGASQAEKGGDIISRIGQARYDLHIESFISLRTECACTHEEENLEKVSPTT